MGCRQRGGWIGKPFTRNIVQPHMGQRTRLVHAGLRRDTDPWRIGADEPYLTHVRDDEQVGAGSMGDEPRPAGQPVPVRMQRGVMEIAGDGLPGNQLGQPLRLLSLTTARRDRLRRLSQTAQHRQGGDLRPCRLRDDGQFDHAQPRTPGAFGKADAGQAQFLTKAVP